MSSHELELQAVLEWQEKSSSYLTHYCLDSEGLSRLIPGTTIQAGSHTKSTRTGWEQLASTFPPRLPGAAEGKRRFLIVVEESQSQSNLGVEDVLTELAQKYNLSQASPAQEASIDRYLIEHLANLGLVITAKDPDYRELKADFMRGLTVTLGSSIAGLSLSAAQPTEALAMSEEKLVFERKPDKPPQVTLNLGPKLYEKARGEIATTLQSYWSHASVYTIRGVLAPPLSVEIDYALGDNQAQIVMHGHRGACWLIEGHFVSGGLEHALAGGYPLGCTAAGLYRGFWVPDGEIEAVTSLGLAHTQDLQAILCMFNGDEQVSRAAELLTFENACSILAPYEDHPAYLALVPDIMKKTTLWRILRRMLEEGLSIRQLGPIFDALLLEDGFSSNFDEIYERLRRSLGFSLTRHFRMHEQDFPPKLWAVPPEFEEEILEGRAGPGLLEKLASVEVSMLAEGRPCAVLTRSPIRRKFVELLATRFPGLCAYTEEELGGHPYQALELT